MGTGWVTLSGRLFVRPLVAPALASPRARLNTAP